MAVKLCQAMLWQRREVALLVAEEVGLSDERDACRKHRPSKTKDPCVCSRSDASRRRHIVRPEALVERLLDLVLRDRGNVSRAARPSATVVLPQEGIPVTTTRRGTAPDHILAYCSGVIPEGGPRRASGGNQHRFSLALRSPP